MQFLIHGYDGADDAALSRRMSVRPRHLENMRRVMEEYTILSAGAITNGEGKPIGSFLVMDFPSREQLDRYLETEPYVTEKVWQKITVETCSTVILDNKMD